MLMKTNFITVEDHYTVDEAITYFRKAVKNKNNIHYIYVVNQSTLVGVISIKELFISDGNQQVKNIMKTELIFVNLDLDQEEVAKIFKDEDLVSIPVINQEKKMVGIIHVDDILDVIQEEATEDFHKMAPVSQLGTTFRDASVWLLYRKRIVWLILLVFMNVFSGAGIAAFEDTIAASITLVFFLPLLNDSAGNAGAQASTLMIRSMATGEVKLNDWLKMFSKEFFVSLLLGITMAISVSVIGIFRGGIEIAIVVGITMVLVVMIGSLVGMSLPFIFKKFKMDPAAASAPLVTSVADIIGVVTYFSLANWVLGL
ncbi:magnesium transporter [Bacillus cereus]|nr:magnesium transporter [Bacillus cereus]